MASMWAKLRAETEEKIPQCIADIPETAFYYYLVKGENGEIIAEGELPRMKLKLPDDYLYKKYKLITIDKTTMVATIQF